MKIYIFNQYHQEAEKWVSGKLFSCEQEMNRYFPFIPINPHRPAGIIYEISCRESEYRDIEATLMAGGKINLENYACSYALFPSSGPRGNLQVADLRFHSFSTTATYHTTEHQSYPYQEESPNSRQEYYRGREKEEPRKADSYHQLIPREEQRGYTGYPVIREYLWPRMFAPGGKQPYAPAKPKVLSFPKELSLALNGNLSAAKSLLENNIEKLRYSYLFEIISQHEKDSQFSNFIQKCCEQNAMPFYNMAKASEKYAMYWLSSNYVDYLDPAKIVDLILEYPEAYLRTRETHQIKPAGRLLSLIKADPAKPNLEDRLCQNPRLESLLNRERTRHQYSDLEYLIPRADVEFDHQLIAALDGNLQAAKYVLQYSNLLSDKNLYQLLFAYQKSSEFHSVVENCCRNNPIRFLNMASARADYAMLWLHSYADYFESRRIVEIIVKYPERYLEQLHKGQISETAQLRMLVNRDTQGNLEAQINKHPKLALQLERERDTYEEQRPYCHYH